MITTTTALGEEEEGALTRDSHRLSSSPTDRQTDRSRSFGGTASQLGKRGKKRQFEQSTLGNVGENSPNFAPGQPASEGENERTSKRAARCRRD